MPRVLTSSDLGAFRVRVCEAASELLAERGNDGFSMRELAAHLGVSAMTAYRYFDSKADIIAAVRASAFDALAEAIESVFEQPNSVTEQLVVACRAYVEFARESPIRYRTMFDISQGQESRSAASAMARQRAYEALAAPARLFARVGPTAGDPETFAQLLWASLYGMLALNFLGAFQETELEGLLLEGIQRLAASCGLHWENGSDRHSPPTTPQPIHATRLDASLRLGIVPLSAAE